MIKKLFLLSSLYLIVLSSTAQNLPIRFEAGALYSYTTDAPPFKAGFGFYFNPSYFLNEQINVGLKAEVIEIGKENGEGTIVHTSAMHSYTIGGSYYFTNGSIRPYINLSLGIYNLTTKAINEGINSSDFEFSMKPGACPKIGVDLGMVTVSFAYNWVYEPFDNISKIDYFSANIGAFIGGKASGSKRNRVISIEDDEDF